jgi:hypothetical protein
MQDSTDSFVAQPRFFGTALTPDTPDTPDTPVTGSRGRTLRPSTLLYAGPGFETSAPNITVRFCRGGTLKMPKSYLSKRPFALVVTVALVSKATV